MFNNLLPNLRNFRHVCYPFVHRRGADAGSDILAIKQNSLAVIGKFDVTFLDEGEQFRRVCGEVMPDCQHGNRPIHRAGIKIEAS